MTNKERAQLLINEAIENLAEVERAFESGSWNRVIRRSQEVVELSLKSLFKLMNVEYPKIHDVAPVLERILSQKRIAVDSQVMQEVKIISKDLTEKRAPAFYAEIMYSKEQAQKASQGAREVLNFAKKLEESLK